MSNSNIVDNVVERLKKQPIGDLITEEDLYDIVNQAIPKVFFEVRTEVEGTGYNSRTITKQPVIYDVMKEVLMKHVQTLVEEWTVKNSDKILEYWTKVTEENIVTYVENIQKERVNGEVRKMLSSYIDQVNVERARMNLPYIYL